MTPRRLTILALAPLLAFGGVIAAALAVSNPASQLAVPFLAFLGLLASEFLVRLQRDPKSQADLRGIILLGVAFRLLLFAAIHRTVGPYVFAPDQWTFESRGFGLLNYWNGVGPLPRALTESVQFAYPGINAAIYLVFGPAKAAPAILNMFFSAWTAIPLYHLALQLVRRNRAVARISAALVVLFPSLMLWSVLNIREAPTILTLTTALYLMVRLQHAPDLRGLLGTAALLSILLMFREYLVFLVGVGAVAGILMGRSTSPVRAMVGGSAILILMAFAAQRFGYGVSLAEEPTLGLAQSLRRGFLFDANSAYGQGADISTPAGALAFLPIGLAYFLFAPFPWDITSVLQAVTLPETLMWYALVPVGVWGAILALRHDPRSFTVPMAVLLTVTFAYALVEGNVGTAYRHRAQILPIVFLFCAIGLRDMHAQWLARVQAARQRRAEARASRTGRSPRPVT
jgi:hypothetical protein